MRRRCALRGLQGERDTSTQRIDALTSRLKAIAVLGDATPAEVDGMAGELVTLRGRAEAIGAELEASKTELERLLSESGYHEAYKVLEGKLAGLEDQRALQGARAGIDQGLAAADGAVVAYRAAIEEEKKRRGKLGDEIAEFLRTWPGLNAPATQPPHDPAIDVWKRFALPHIDGTWNIKKVVS
jgi:DNA repair exonuclease SbcCD ATPase subunit